MAESWPARWASGWTAGAQRFDAYHLGPGKGGGQFTSSGGAGSGPQAASHAGGSVAARKTALRQQAQADRLKAHQLEQQLAGLLKQEAKAHAAAKQAAAAAKHHHGTAAAHKAHKHHRAAHKHHLTLKQRISALRQQISTLLAQAAHLDAQAAAL